MKDREKSNRKDKKYYDDFDDNYKYSNNRKNVNYHPDKKKSTREYLSELDFKS